MTFSYHTEKKADNIIVIASIFPPNMLANQ